MLFYSDRQIQVRTLFANLHILPRIYFRLSLSIGYPSVSELLHVRYRLHPYHERQLFPLVISSINVNLKVKKKRTNLQMSTWSELPKVENMSLINLNPF